MKINDIKVLKEGTLSIDVPTEAWLQDKIDYARSKGRNSYGVPYMGSTTASVRGTPPRVRVLRLASLPGMRNEQTNVRRDDLKWLMDYMDTHKKLPPMGSSPDDEYLPYIMVAYNGEAWVNEGNHRIMAAYRLNWPDMPIEIRYFDGGERVRDGAMYPGKIGLGEADVPKSESVTEIFEPGKQNWKWRRQSSDEAFASFVVGDREYQWHAFNSDANTTKWEIQFRLMRVPADPDGLDLFGQTGTGNSAQVLSTAVDITRAFLQAYGLDKVEEITFNAKEDSRIDLYAKMIKRLLPTWELSNRKSLSHGMQFTLTDPRAYDKPENKITEKIDPDILHPDYKFQQKIGKFNYTASSYAGNGGKPMLKIEASDKVGTVGHAYFTVVNDAKGGHLESLNTYVHDDFQKKNIATTMYTIAKMLGNDIKPSSSLLPGGQAMWKSWKKSGDAKHLANNESEDLTEAESTGWTALEVVESILGKDRVTADDDELVQGMYYVYESNSPPAFEDTEEPGQTGGAIRLRDLEAADPQAIAEAAHEACHAYAHSKSTSGVLYTNEKIINNLAEIWLKKNLSGANLHFALEHILGSKLHYGPDHMPRSMAEGSLEELANTSLKVKEPKDFVNVNDRKQVTYKVMKFKSGKDTYLINFTVKGAPAYGKKSNWNAVNVAFGVREEQDDYSFGDEINTDLTARNKNQFLIYSTVINAVRKFITEYNTEIDEIIMQGAGERQAVMYQRFFQSAGKYFPGWHYDGKHSLVRDVPRQPVKKVREQGVAEARTNPEQNPKPESGFKELAAVAKTIADPQNWAISMTSEPKLGINPQVGISEDTPKGIYFYPLNYVLDKTRYGKLPWGHDYPYIQLFQYDRSGEMTKETSVDSTKLKQALLQYCSEEVIQSAIDEPEYDGTPYWTIYDCLSRLGKSDETNIVRWNKVLRDLGFTSVYDDGHGWIAYNEPTQGVVLDPRVIKQLKTITNKKQSGVVTPAVIERAIFETMDMELAANRAWQAYDPDGSKLRAAAKEYAKKPEFKQYYGKPGTEEIFDKAEGMGRYGARELSQESYEWFKAQQAQKTESITEGGHDVVSDLEQDLENPHSYDAIDHMMQTIARDHGITAKKLHDLFVDKHGQVPDEWVNELAENFADGKNPQDKGDSQRHGIPKGATMAELEKAAKAPGRKGQLARWQLNMRRGRKKATEGIVNEGGWASTETQNTTITPRTVAEIVHILDGFEASYNAWQAANELDAEIKIGKPKGSGTYYRRDLEQDPNREYGDVDVECFIHSREGVKSAQRTTEYKRAITDYCAQSPDFSTDNGTNVIMRTTAGPVQVDLIYTFHEHADWSRVLSPEYRVKGVISTSLTSALAEALNLSFSSQGIQVKIRNNQPVSFRQSKDTELRTVTNKPETWAQDVYALYYYLSHGEKPAEMPRDLRAHGGFKDEQRLSDIVLSIKALAAGLEEAGLLGHGSLIGIPDKRDLIRKVAQIYSAKLEAAENSSKFDKAATPAAVEKAKKTKLMLAKYRNEVTKLLLN